jgi:hypothetical protein
VVRGPKIGLVSGPEIGLVSELRAAFIRLWMGTHHQHHLW